MRYLILADIHDNLEAFERVIDEKEKWHIDHIVFLGDVLGYGANPKECLHLAQKVSTSIIFGNHEYALISPELMAYFSYEAVQALTWTSDALNEDDIAFIRTLSLELEFPHFMMVHGSPYRPKEFNYLCDSSDAERAFRRMDKKICFVGHTHVPVLFTEGETGAPYLNPGTYKLKKRKRYIVNPGSVGQPRDHDKRLSCAVFDDKKYQLELIRLDYDNRKAADKIIHAGLPEALAQRLL